MLEERSLAALESAVLPGSPGFGHWLCCGNNPARAGKKGWVLWSIHLLPPDRPTAIHRSCPLSLGGDDLRGDSSFRFLPVTGSLPCLLGDHPPADDLALSLPRLRYLGDPESLLCGDEEIGRPGEGRPRWASAEDVGRGKRAAGGKLGRQE